LDPCQRFGDECPHLVAHHGAELPAHCVGRASHYNHRQSRITLANDNPLPRDPIEGWSKKQLSPI
jgi:hypothetical protein